MEKTKLFSNSNVKPTESEWFFSIKRTILYDAQSRGLFFSNHVSLHKHFFKSNLTYEGNC